MGKKSAIVSWGGGEIHGWGKIDKTPLHCKPFSWVSGDSKIEKLRNIGTWKWIVVFKCLAGWYNGRTP